MQAMAAEPGDPVDIVRKAINSVSPGLAEDFDDGHLQSLAAAGFQRADEFRKVERKELMALGLTLAQAADLQHCELQRPCTCGCTHDCFTIWLLDSPFSGERASAHAHSVT